MYFTIFIFLSGVFLRSFGLVTAIMASIFTVSNYLDLIKKIPSSSMHDISFIKISQIALLKIPYLIHESLPYIVFVSAILTFQRLAKRNEYTILKASGMSIWHFLTPFIVSGFIIGAAFVTIINPISSQLLSVQKKEESKILNKNIMSFSLFKKGVWFVDKNIDDSQTRLVNSQFIDLDKMQLSNTTFLTFDKDFKLVDRIYAKQAFLGEEEWNLEDVTMFKLSHSAQNKPKLTLHTNLQYEDIKDSLVEPNIVSIWELPYVIQNLQQSGYSTIRHTSYLYKILIKPLLICALIIIAASFSLRHGRGVKISRSIAYGSAFGFAMFFLGELTSFLGSSGQISPLYANLLAVATIFVVSLSSIYYSNET